MRNRTALGFASALLAGCMPLLSSAEVVDSMTLAASSRPIPTDFTIEGSVNATTCNPGADIQAAIQKARGDNDAIVQVTIEASHTVHFERYPSDPLFGSRVTGFDPECFTVSGLGVRFRKAPAPEAPPAPPMPAAVPTNPPPPMPHGFPSVEPVKK